MAAKENVLTRKIGPLPTWVWVGIAAAAILLYVVIKDHSASATKAKGKGAGLENSAYLVPPYIWQYQNFPPEQHHGGGKGGGGKHHHKKHKRHDKGGGGGEGGEGPEREWLEHKTGSEHPWTYLAQHHESIDVGPHGSRIVRTH